MVLVIQLLCLCVARKVEVQRLGIFFSLGVVIPYDFVCACVGGGVGVLMGEGTAAWDFFFPMCS